MARPDTFRVFISAVSSEFGEARSLVASDLRARGIEVKVQEDFRQEEVATTLAKLYNYIEDCSAVVCVIGRRSGSLPPPAAAQLYADILPKGLEQASYTQWELLFARHYKKRLSLYHAVADYEPDEAEPTDEDHPELQAQFVQWLFDDLGLDRGNFSNPDELGRLVLREEWPQSSLIEQAVSILATAQDATDDLGQRAQRLHGRAAAFDPATPTAETDAKQLLADVIEYLDVHDSTLGLMHLDGRLPTIGASLRSGDKSEEVKALLAEGEDLIEEILDETRFLESSTGIGAETLVSIRDELQTGRWRDAPKEARSELRAANERFKTKRANGGEAESVKWLKLSRQFAALQQKLLDVGRFDAEEEENRLVAQRAEIKPKPLFSLRLPEEPRKGNIDNYETVYFEDVLITVITAEERILRFALSMPDREFLDFGKFQVIYQDKPYIHDDYFSNPLDIARNRQAALAFIHTPGSGGTTETFEVSVRDMRAQKTFTITELGELTFFDDGSMKRA